MVATNKTIQVTFLIRPDGRVFATLKDTTSINTILQDWKRSIPPELMQEHKDAKTLGGAVMVTMLTRDWHALVNRNNLPVEILE